MLLTCYGRFCEDVQAIRRCYVERLQAELEQPRPLKRHDRPQAQYILDRKPYNPFNELSSTLGFEIFGRGVQKYCRSRSTSCSNKSRGGRQDYSLVLGLLTMKAYQLLPVNVALMTSK